MSTESKKSPASEGLSQDERNAVKERAKELRAEAKAGKSRAAGEKALLEAIAAMTPDEKELAEGIHAIVSEVAPELFPKTYYSMPAWANADGKIVLFFQPATKFKARYSTLGFEGAAALDDGDMWSTAFALVAFTPATKKRITELVEKAAG
ncbi:hypothetical protein [Microbacterium sp. 2FI]|uniref:hypothetical protein n=1 Tax=Microbacterium sp. 2FI TaxID=2502193 RepID=UPI0010F47F2B|nr:hypothetical protein [Microbacterium sp. 2FI]